MKKLLSYEEKLLIIRKKLNLTSTQMSAGLGYSPKQYLRFESGETPIKPDVIEKIIEVYKVRREWIDGDAYSEIDPCTILKPEDEYKNKPKDVAQRIIELRRENGLSRTQFMERTGVTASTLSRIENGTTNLNPRVAQKIADTFEIGVDWLINGNKKRRLYPVNEYVIEYLWEHPNLREQIWEKIKLG